MTTEIHCSFCSSIILGPGTEFCHNCINLKKEFLRVEEKERYKLFYDYIDAAQLRELRTVLQKEIGDPTQYSYASWLIYFNPDRTAVTVELWYKKDFHCFALTTEELKKFLRKRPPWRKYFGPYQLDKADKETFKASVVEMLATLSPIIIPSGTLLTTCPVCEKEGKKPKTFITDGPTYAKPMEPPPFTDKEGVRHWHLVGFSTIYYQCSNDHRWYVNHYLPCIAPGCIYGKESKIEILK